MPRKTHKDPAYATEDIRGRMNLMLPQSMRRFLELEAKRLTEEKGRTIEEADIVKALITAYYEKRMAGLLIGPDD